MTTEKAKKQAVRARMEEAGESYTESLRHVEQKASPGDVPFIYECVNCDAPLEMENRSLFCSEFCMQVASFVRYARRVVVDPNRWADPQVREAMQIRQAHLLGGGYDENARRLTSTQRTFIIERDGGVCAECGEPADEIDHIDGSLSDPGNLQLLCDRCHNEKTRSVMVPATEEQTAWGTELWATRVMVEVPVRLGDDEVRWEQVCRGLKSERTRLLWDQLEAETGLNRADLRGMSWEEAVAEAYDPNVLPGEDLLDDFENLVATGQAPGWVEEQVQEAWYLQDQMAKDD